MKTKTWNILLIILLLLIALSTVSDIEPHSTKNLDTYQSIQAIPRLCNGTEVTINFVGNLSDLGGPYFCPPSVSKPLTGGFLNGYYTNDSKQQEDWMYINITILNTKKIEMVWCNLLNESTWTNWTYTFDHTTHNYYEINTSKWLFFKGGSHYSFDVVVNTTDGYSKKFCWNKTGIGNNETRQYVYLGCTPQDGSYLPYYFYEAAYSLDDVVPPHQKYDKMHHDQGLGQTLEDTGYLLLDIPTDKEIFLRCNSFVGLWFDESFCWKNSTLKNIYFHFWWHSDHDEIDDIGYNKLRKGLCNIGYDCKQKYSTSVENSRSTILSNISGVSLPYYLETHLMTIKEPIFFNDNDIYELCVGMNEKVDVGPSYGEPKIVDNRSFTSFVILNIPDNATLNRSYYDSDNDLLSDWFELYCSYTNPFLSDTDNDGIDDYWEYYTGSDPNNYTHP